MSNKEILDRLKNDIKLRGLSQNALEEYPINKIFADRWENFVASMAPQNRAIRNVVLH